MPVTEFPERALMPWPVVLLSTVQPESRPSTWVLAGEEALRVVLLLLLMLVAAPLLASLVGSRQRKAQ